MKKSMISIKAATALFFLFFFFGTVLLQAQSTLTVQGVLKNQDGTAVEDDDYQVTFQLHDSDNGAAKVWPSGTPSATTVSTTNGVYSVVLGPFPGVPFDQTYYLGVKVGSKELFPRPQLTAAPYAFSLLGADNKFPSSGDVVMGDNASIQGDASIQGNVGIRNAPSTNIPLMIKNPDGMNGISIGFSGKELLGIGNAGGSGYNDLVLSIEDNTASGFTFTKGGHGGPQLMRLGGDGSLNIKDESGTELMNLRAGGSDVRFIIDPTSPNTGKFTVKASGHVHIGNSADDYAWFNVHETQNSNTSGGYLDQNGNTGPFGAGIRQYSIYSYGSVRAAEFHATSDARIKRVLGATNTTEDLTTIQNIKIQNYEFIDKVSKGDQIQKKVIAQELEEVYPTAVSTSIGVVPDIYKRGTVKNGRVTVANALKSGDRVKLILEDKEEIVDVLAADANGFTVDLDAEGEVFIYGREVRDFKLVDYEALTTLNISATQELLKKINTQEAKIDRMQAQLDMLSAAVQGLVEQKPAGTAQQSGASSEK